MSFRGADQTEWQRAVTNYPVTSGNLFWTEPSSAAELGIGATNIAMDQSTEFDVNILDDRTFQATQPQGTVFLRVRQMAAGDLYRITTPRGAVVLTKAGAYEIVAGDADRPTWVTVVEGGARIDSTHASLTLVAGQTGRIEGTSDFAVSVGPVVMDRFLTARLDQEREIVRNRAATVRVAPPQAVAQMSGGEALANTGTWAASASYGQIWYPPVQSSWVPYRDGHWGYVAPWGWTWIDDAPWGFAPFHYGRWVQDGPRWGWIPRERGVSISVAVEPVYAPALVSFISVGVAVGVALSQGDRRDPRGSVGWVPLGPRETYVPPYQTSDRYVRDVNVGNVTNVTTINTVNNVNNVTNVTNLVNRNAATVVPVTAMTASQPVAARRENITPQTLATAQAQRAAPVQPTTATIGVTPVVAKELNLAAPTTPPPTVAVAPGPVAPPPAAKPVVIQSQPAAPVAVVPGAVPADPRAPAPRGSATPVPGVPVPGAPVAVTLPVLRPPTPVAPAHPDANRVPGAAGPTVPLPGGGPAPTPVIVPPVVPGVPIAPVPKPAPTPGSATPAVPAPPVVPAPQAATPGMPTLGNVPPVVPVPPATPTPPVVPAPKPLISAPVPIVPVPPVVTPPQANKPVSPVSEPPKPAVPVPPRPHQPSSPAPDVAKPVVPVPPVVAPAPPQEQPTPPAPPAAVRPVSQKNPQVDGGNNPDTKPKP